MISCLLNFYKNRTAKLTCHGFIRLYFLVVNVLVEYWHYMKVARQLQKTLISAAVILNDQFLLILWVKWLAYLVCTCVTSGIMCNEAVINEKRSVWSLSPTKRLESSINLNSLTEKTCGIITFSVTCAGGTHYHIWNCFVTPWLETQVSFVRTCEFQDVSGIPVKNLHISSGLSWFPPLPLPKETRWWGDGGSQIQMDLLQSTSYLCRSVSLKHAKHERCFHSALNKLIYMWAWKRCIKIKTPLV